jgi:geranylgeranyl diphosphate synthase type II
VTPTARLKQRQRWIEQALRRALRLPAGSPAVLEQAMRYCVLSPGKRFRPLLCLGGCEAAGGTGKRALPVACAVELIHAYSLVHDDLPAMDNADQRRGRPSCHRRFGEANAILVGDALLTRAFELLGDPALASPAPILRELGRSAGAVGLVGGQALDLALGAQGSGLSMRKLEEIARRKTAALITASVVTGGLAAGVRPAAVDSLRRYGAALGLAFQLIDDVHDRDGLARRLSPDQVRQRALRLIDAAKRAVRPFGSRASTVIDLADWLASTA